MLGRARRLALPFGLAWLALLGGVVPRFVLVWRTTSVSFVLRARSRRSGEQRAEAETAAGA